MSEVDHLLSITPRGATLAVFYPDTALSEKIARLAQEKRCRVVCVGGDAVPLAKHIDPRLSVSSADLFFARPQVLTPGGGLFDPNIARAAGRFPLIGVGASRLALNSAELDFVPLRFAVTEQGVFRGEHVEFID